jgi:hypothetical protein
MAGFQISDALYIGYGYDLETTKLNNYNSGSHEVFLRYDLFKNNDKITTLDSSKTIIKNNILFYITIISVFIKHLFTKAR